MLTNFFLEKEQENITKHELITGIITVDHVWTHSILTLNGFNKKKFKGINVNIVFYGKFLKLPT